jgi:hypothetical protein
MRVTRLFTLLACLSVVASGAAVSGQSDPAHEQHRHGGAAALVTKLELQDGKRWPTDSALRTGMAAIRAAFDADHPAIHEGRETDAQYTALASRIEREVNTIVAQCKLPPAADAQLHYVVGDLLQGVALLRGDDPARSRHDGARLVHGALNAYGKYFEDPTWTADAGPAHGHDHDH